MGHPVVEKAVAIAVEVHGSRVTVTVDSAGALAVCVTAITVTVEVGWVAGTSAASLAILSDNNLPVAGFLYGR